MTYDLIVLKILLLYIKLELIDLLQSWCFK